MAGWVWGAGCPVMTEIALLPKSVTMYLAGPPKKSTLYSMNPKASNCLTSQTVIQLELSAISSSSSELLRPSLLLAIP